MYYDGLHKYDRRQQIIASLLPHSPLTKAKHGLVNKSLSCQVDQHLIRAVIQETPQHLRDVFGNGRQWFPGGVGILKSEPEYLHEEALRGFVKAYISDRVDRTTLFCVFNFCNRSAVISKEGSG
jgi:hypothetical protein